MNGIDAAKEAGPGGEIKGACRSTATIDCGGNPRWTSDGLPVVLSALLQDGWSVIRRGPAKPPEAEPYKTPIRFVDGFFCDADGERLAGGATFLTRLNATVEAEYERGYNDGIVEGHKCVLPEPPFAGFPPAESQGLLKWALRYATLTDADFRAMLTLAIAEADRAIDQYATAVRKARGKA